MTQKHAVSRGHKECHMKMFLSHLDSPLGTMLLVTDDR